MKIKDLDYYIQKVKRWNNNDSTRYADLQDTALYLDVYPSRLRELVQEGHIKGYNSKETDNPGERYPELETDLYFKPQSIAMLEKKLTDNPGLRESAGDTDLLATANETQEPSNSWIKKSTVNPDKKLPVRDK